jgi:O-acetylserine/cysteine efflux transporter
MTEGRAATPRHRLLLALLIVVWAVSWPVIKVGITAVPPIWFACARYGIATGCLFALVTWRRELALPSRSDWRLVVVSGVLQMGVFSALAGLALTVLSPGRASVLAYSTPLWVVPLAAWRLGERASRRGLAGVAIGLAGVLVIAAPAFQRGASRQLLPYAMLMAAAAAWAISIVFVRGHRFDASPLALAPWQTLVAATLLLPLALVVEGTPPSIGPRALASLAYVGPVATAFAYWAVVEAGRHLPARTISMALLVTPSLGVLISSITLGESASLSLMSGIVLVAVGVGLASEISAHRPSATASSRDLRLVGARPAGSAPRARSDRRGACR